MSFEICGASIYATPFLLSIPSSYDVMTALLFALIAWNSLHQQAGALLSHWTFSFGYEDSCGWSFLELWD